jgi:hypothetical protein
MKTKLILLLSLYCNVLFAQIAANNQQSLLGFIAAKEYSKDIALYNAKKFVVDEIIGPSDSIVKFEIDALVASNSGELITLVYKCVEKNKEGLLFGFYNNSWNNAGVIYSGYCFKDLQKANALELIYKLQTVIDKNSSYLDDDHDNNNVCFKYDDMTFIIYSTLAGSVIRVFWNGFYAEWSGGELNRTQRRLAKKLNEPNSLKVSPPPKY